MGLRNILFDLFVFFIIFVFFCNAQLPKPKITSAEQKSERSVELKWSISTGDYSLTHYIVELMENDDVNTVKEWPAQMKNADVVITTSSSKTVTSSSYFDCRNKCINNLNCSHSERTYLKTSSNTNCILKYGRIIGGSPAQTKDSEYMQLKGYEDNTLIDGLPYNNIYKFRVKVFDYKSREWSGYSDWSTEVDMEIKLQLTITRIDFYKIKLEWKQMNALSQANYIISKYEVTVRRNNTFYYSQQLADENMFEKFTLSPNYDSEFYVGDIVNATNEDVCYSECKKRYECVLAVYFNDPMSVYLSNGSVQTYPSKTCFNKKKLNLHAAMLSRIGTSAFSIKNNAKQFEIETLVINNNYILQLECLTPFGTNCISNEFHITITDLKPDFTIAKDSQNIESDIKWKIEEKIEVNKVKIFVGNNTSNQLLVYYKDENIDYDGSIHKDPLALSLNECYDECFNHTSCVSIMWHSNNSCILRDNKNKSNSCPPSAKCISMFDDNSQISMNDQLLNTEYCYKMLVRVTNGFNGILSDAICVTFEFNIDIIELIDKKYSIENGTIKLFCNYTAVNQSVLSGVQWLKDGTDLNLFDLNLAYSNNNHTITLTNITRYKYDGSYSCKVTFKGKQEIESRRLVVNVKSTPGKPVLLNATTTYTSSIIKWYFDEDGGLNITKIIVQYCEYSNFTENLQEIEYKFGPIKNEITLNKKLPLNYYARIIAFNEIGSSEPSDMTIIECEIADCEKVSSAKRNVEVAVATSLSSVALILLIVFVVVIIIRRRKKSPNASRDENIQRDNTDVSQNGSETTSHVNDESNVIQAPPVLPRKPIKQEQSRDDSENNEERINDDSNSETRGRDRPDIREKYYQFWQNNIQNIDEKMRFEFSQIKNPTNLPTIEAVKKCSYKKSRYKQIYPFDHNRVKLSVVNAIEGSDFINASHIEVVEDQMKFIAAQAPTLDTLEDFYRMIYEYKLKVIVMLTVFETNNSKQCFRYFNDEGMFQYKNFTFQTIKIEDHCTYIKRTLLFINNTDPDFQQIITHYQYVEWPDKSIPDESQSIVELIDCVNNEHGQRDWPILVHCSAGVGRTGTYIVLDSVLEMIEKQMEIDLVQFINTLRLQRVYLVQTWEQYKFIYQTILESYIFGNTKINGENYVTKYNKLNGRRSNKKNDLQKEFEKLTLFKDRLRNFNIFNTYPNRFVSPKFRPYDEGLLILDKIRNDDSTRFFDAVHLLSSHHPMEFVIASDALEFHDYPRLALKAQPAVIVSLSTNVYLPRLNTIQNIDGGFTITNKDEIGETFKFYLLDIVKEAPNESAIETVYLDYLEWNKRDIPENRDLFIEFVHFFLDLIDKLREITKNDPVILVYSSDAGNRSAMFVAATVLMYKIKMHNSFDVFQTVYWLRKYRENMISELENYKCLYDMAFSYFEQMKNIRESEHT